MVFWTRNKDKGAPAPRPSVTEVREMRFPSKTTLYSMGAPAPVVVELTLVFRTRDPHVVDLSIEGQHWEFDRGLLASAVLEQASESPRSVGLGDLSIHPVVGHGEHVMIRVGTDEQDTAWFSLRTSVARAFLLETSDAHLLGVDRIAADLERELASLLG